MPLSESRVLTALEPAALELSLAATERLEHTWEDKLAAKPQLEEEYHRFVRNLPRVLSEAERVRVRIEWIGGGHLEGVVNRPEGSLSELSTYPQIWKPGPSVDRGWLDCHRPLWGADDQGVATTVGGQSATPACSAARRTGAGRMVESLAGPLRHLPSNPYGDIIQANHERKELWQSLRDRKRLIFARFVVCGYVLSGLSPVNSAVNTAIPLML